MNDKEREYCKAVGLAIKALREELTGKSSLMFSYENDIPKSTMSRIERGENEAQLVTLKKIAEGFGWSMEELFRHVEERLPDNLLVFNDEHY